MLVEPPLLCSRKAQRGAQSRQAGMQRCIAATPAYPTVTLAAVLGDDPPKCNNTMQVSNFEAWVAWVALCWQQP